MKCNLDGFIHNWKKYLKAVELLCSNEHILVIKILSWRLNTNTWMRDKQMQSSSVRPLYSRVWCVLASQGHHWGWLVSHVGLWLKAWWTRIRKCCLDCPGMELSLPIIFFVPCCDLPSVRWFSEDQEILTDVCINRKCDAPYLRLLLGSEGIRWPPASCLLSSEKCSTALLYEVGGTVKHQWLSDDPDCCSKKSL